MIPTIMVAIDQDDASKAALLWAIELASILSAKVVGVHACGLLNQDSNGSITPTKGHMDSIRERFGSEWAKPLSDSGLDYELVLRDGNPVSVLLMLESEVGADLIVVGSRGHSVIGGLIDSTSHHVSEAARCPVVIVHPPL
ncbi:universal stress protein [Acidithrix ferrooxidans]|uniref:Stress response protein NhaX n=1 Tax=Acidithrix ferrooxidans TaxID=1280514 RepID=A0A0D8HLU1_9ACTN|nr:universal stress protein [Acidithrix ferrooxidans]KJF18960.1 stress response protein NhaX [Acidithrix ferrooxidans]